MKQCPQCNRTYDDSQAFCLMDGTPLIVESEQETVIRRPAAAPKKRRWLLWLGLTGLVILAGLITVGLAVYGFLIKGETSRTKHNTNISSTPAPTPKPASTPPVSATPVSESSPKNDNSEPPPDTDEADEITPIQWNTSAVTFKNDDGRTYKFRCPPNGAAGTVWGSDIYTTDSSICTAAVHAGLFSLTEGGVVTIEFRPGRQIYGSTERNGITSSNYGEYPHSFVVR